MASKVYYYLGELGDALTYALGAGKLFNVDERSEYVETLLAKAIDEYCAQHVSRSEQQAVSLPVGDGHRPRITPARHHGARDAAV